MKIPISIKYSFLLVTLHTLTPSLAKEKCAPVRRTARNSDPGNPNPGNPHNADEVDEDSNPNEITHGKANLGDACFHNCDCNGFPDVRCEKRAFGQKKCYPVCKQIDEPCSVNSDCCSQTCSTWGKCRPFDGPRSGRPVPSAVGFCDILFPFDKLPADPPLVPNGLKPYVYVMPSRTGPLREIEFCPKHPQGQPDDLVRYELKGWCVEDATVWTDIQEGDITIHRDGDCFRIPVAYEPQLVSGHDPIVDYTKYHIVFYIKDGEGDTYYPRKPLVGPQPNNELRFFAKCSEAIDWGKPVNYPHGLHPETQ